MVLSFKKSEIAFLVEQTDKAASHSVPYTGPSWGEPLRTDPGLILVGDDGVYFMSNRDGEDNHADLTQGGDSRNVVYALECNPATCPDCYEVKRDTFGGDDGAEFIPIETIRKLLATEGSRIGVLFNGCDLRFVTLP